MILFWVAVLGSSLLLYVLLDGFDLGVGILFAFTHDDRHRNRMLAAISPVWDGNETWPCRPFTCRCWWVWER